MNKKELRKLIKKGESRNLEFKESLSMKNEIGENVSGFANTCEGIILIGVSDLGEIKGVEIGKRTIESLANFIKQNTDNSVYSDIKIVRIGSKDIIVVKIKEQSEKPVFFRGRAYVRVGKSNHKMSASEIRKLAKESSKSYWDEKVCEGAGLGDVDEEKVKGFLRKARVERGLKIDENIQIKETLMKLKLMRNGKLTNVAILLFAKEVEKFFLQAEVKCIRFKGNEPVKPYIDFQTLTGNVIDIIDKAEDFVLRNIKKAVWLEPGKIERQERYEYPEDAIREAVVNAVVHRDYSSPSKVQVRIFDDYLEIWNPGELPKGWTIEKLKKKHESIPKNPLLFKQLFWIKYVEDVGGGILDMISKCKEWGIPEPEFEFTGTSLITVFKKAILTEELMNKFGLNERQKKAVQYMQEHNEITNKEYCELCGVVKDTVNRDISELLIKGLIEKKGSGAKTHYVIRNVRYRPIPSDTVR